MSLKFILIGGGIFFSFWIFGVLQERLYKGTFGPDEEIFNYVLSVLFISQIVSSAYAYAALKMLNVHSESQTPAVYQFSIAMTYLLAMIASQMALKWVSYPAQVLAKSSKPIPVLIFGVLLGNKSYHLARYIMVLSIVIGVCLFMFNDEKAGKGEFGVGMGELLLALSLILDGLYNSLQERVLSKHPTIKSSQFMFDINVASLIILGIAVAYTGEMFHFANFAGRHPIVILWVFAVCLTSAVGQFCIYRCITEYGTLTVAVITTTRKFFTVLSSIIIFGHILKVRQWVGIAFVFGGLGLDIYYGKKKIPAAAP